MTKPKDFPDYCKSGEVHTRKMTEAEKEAFEKERAARHKKYHWRDSKNAVNDAENYTVSVIKQRDRKGGIADAFIGEPHTAADGVGEHRHQALRQPPRQSEQRQPDAVP